MSDPLRLAFDQNFPLALIDRISDFLPRRLELSSLYRIDRRLTALDDRPLLIALRQLGWAGLITNNCKMLYEPREVATIVATKSVVVAVEGLGHDPLRAAGALLLELPGLADRLLSNRASVFLLRYQRRQAEDAWRFLADAAHRRGQDPSDLWHAHRPADDELSAPVLD